jgi:signal transduction histidine kinase
MNQAQIETNISLEKALRRANLLAAAAQASQNMTRILDIDELLPKTVDIICDAYGFYYAGVFLIDEAGEFAVLRAGRGEPGRIMIENNHKLAVGGNSMIGACTSLNEARISLDVDTEKVWYPNPVLPQTRSEMALPLAIGGQVIGAVTVQSVEPAAFSEEDISSLQAMANQLTIAIDNARQRRALEETHAKLVKAKTFEAIATATGDAIHWIGNKAEPIPGSVKRVCQDIELLVSALADVLPEQNGHPLLQLVKEEAEAIVQNNPRLQAEVEKVKALPADKLSKRLSLSSVMEDLEIIDSAASIIMKVKEDLIGPAREQAPRPAMLDDIIKDTVNSLGNLPREVVTINVEGNLPLIVADPVQLNRVFSNLIKNAYEAMENQPQPQITVTVYRNGTDDFVKVDVNDNGSGISRENLDKMWVTFYTTKGLKGHSGLGLPACRLILEQIGGHISAATKLGEGSTFTVSLPVYKDKEPAARVASAKGKILVVDDADSWQYFAKTSLEAAGYKVAAAGEGYRAADYQQYDLVLVDDILANQNSLDVYKALKQAGVISKTVAISSNPRVERTKERMLLGLQNLLPKPYTRASLLGEVAKALQARR